VVSELSPRAMVLRFEQERYKDVKDDLASAERMWRNRHGRLNQWVVSCWCDDLRPGETWEQLRWRLVREVGTTGLASAQGSSPPTWTATLEGVEATGVTVRKEGTEGERTLHYCVDFGENKPDQTAVERFMGAFEMSKEQP